MEQLREGRVREVIRLERTPQEPRWLGGGAASLSRSGPSGRPTSRPTTRRRPSGCGRCGGRRRRRCRTTRRGSAASALAVGLALALRGRLRLVDLRRRLQKRFEAVGGLDRAGLVGVERRAHRLEVTAAPEEDAHRPLPILALVVGRKKLVVRREDRLADVAQLEVKRGDGLARRDVDHAGLAARPRRRDDDLATVVREAERRHVEVVLVHVDVHGGQRRPPGSCRSWR